VRYITYNKCTTRLIRNNILESIYCAVTLGKYIVFLRNISRIVFFRKYF